ncbi:hypothetical protein [Ensifer sp. BR816]|uniref:hypothetical protein n=1 Tax=Rhizobium sp. (strain BR816) TaxID=1057002 RepID=UPI0003811FB7|nr:hypothetical protein [Ensifer sp. BR816]
MFARAFREDKKLNGLESLLSFTPALQPQSLSYVRTFLRLVHFAGLVIGFGGAVFLDLFIARYRRMTMTAELISNIEWVSRFVALGLLLLWISGAGFLLLYQMSEPEKLMNPKIWAKVTIVAILSINGFAIHRLVLPFLRRRIGSQLLAGLKPRTKVALIWCGVVSAVSWSVPVVLGAAPQLNFAVPCTAILGAYALALAQAFLIAVFVLRDRGEVAKVSGPC